MARRPPERDKHPVLSAVVGLSLAAFLIHAATSHPGQQAGGGPARASVTARHQPGAARTASRAAATAIAFARSQLGKPYVYGAPRWAPGAAVPAAYDCASLAQWAWARAGVSIPLTSEAQWAGLRHVPLSQARPGDLIFETGAPLDSPPGHVVMFLGWRAGHAWIIEAYGSGYPVRIVHLRWATAWRQAARP